MPELVLIALAAAAVGTVIIAPLLRPARPIADDRAAAAATRYRVALEALRDVEADHRTGALTERDYAAERQAAEERAARVLRELEGAAHPDAEPSPVATGPARRTALGAALVIGLAVVAGSLVPPPVGVASQTVIDQPLADAQAAEADRRARIEELTTRVERDPSDTEALSDLADAFLSGSSADDLARGAAALLVLIALDPGDEDAHRRIISAYLRAGDYPNASAALDSFEALDPPAADVAFFRGLLALRGDGDMSVAIREFDRFLELAPDDERAPMVRAVRAEAAGAER